MRTADAFMMSLANMGKELMVFDWNEAARLIKEHNPKVASAGLHSDWEYTGGVIFEDGEPVANTYTYLASTWATPELELDGKIYSCYKMQSEVPRWSEKTKWPKSALKILKG